MDSLFSGVPRAQAGPGNAARSGQGPLDEDPGACPGLETGNSGYTKLTVSEKNWNRHLSCTEIKVCDGKSAVGSASMEIRSNIMKCYFKKFFVGNTNTEILDYASWKDTYPGS